MSYIYPQERNTLSLSMNLEDVIPPDSIVWIIDFVVEKFCSDAPQDTVAGRPSYRIKDLTKLHLYGFFKGLTSSRKLEEQCKINIEVMWLMGRLTPDHWTINNFLSVNKDTVKEIQKKFQIFLREEGLIKLETVVVDGTKVKACTNKDKLVTLDSIKSFFSKIDKNFDEYTDKLLQGSEVTEETISEYIEEHKETLYKVLKKQNQEEIDKIIKTLLEQKKVLEEKGTKFLFRNDYECNMMKTREGFQPAYNVQASVDAENKMLISLNAHPENTDVDLLPKVIDEIKETQEVLPQIVITDSGYFNSDAIEKIEKNYGIDTYVQGQIPVNSKKDDFIYNEEKDVYICPGNKELKYLSKSVGDKYEYRVYRCKECNKCPIKDQCTTSKRGRTIKRFLNEKFRDKYKKKIAENRSKLDRRKSIIEHVNGNLKILLGKIPLYVTGIAKVNIKMGMFMLSYNLKRLINVLGKSAAMQLLIDYKMQPE